MKSHRINLIGNVYHDTIFRLGQQDIEIGITQLVNKIHERMGGIYNFTRAMKDKEGIQINIHSYIDTFTEILIQYELESNKSIYQYGLERSVVPRSYIIVGKNSVKTTLPFVKIADSMLCEIPLDKLTEADWSHIMYLDRLPFINAEYLKKVKSLSKMVSIDLCSSKPSAENLKRISECLEYIDVIFLSEHEYKQFVDYYANHNGHMDANKLKAKCIIHTSKHVIVISLKDLLEFVLEHDNDTWCDHAGTKINVPEVYDNINPIGAGDFFAANFIYHCLNKECDEIKNIIELTIKDTASLLLQNWQERITR